MKPQILLIIACALLLALLPSISAASGTSPLIGDATFTVTKTADTNDGACGSDCSLREAIIAADADPGADTISVPAGTYNLTLYNGEAPDTYDPTQGDLEIWQSVTIVGAGPGSTIIDGMNQDRVFFVVSEQGITVHMEGLTIQHGRTDNGAGINNNGNLTLTNVILAHNTATEGGGGIMNAWGAVALTTSTISDNSALEGGGIYNNANHTFSIISSTITRNSADNDGGGIANAGTLSMGSSLLSANASGPGGGIYNEGNATISHSTITGNSSYDMTNGSGIYNNGALSLVNSTVAKNTGSFQTAQIAHSGNTLTIRNSTITESPAMGLWQMSGTVQLQNTILNSSCEGTVTSIGNNLVPAGVGCSMTLLPSDRTGSPGLGAFNGAYAPLLASSEAIDKGNPAACTPTDQIGNPRRDGDGDGTVVCDIGAIEYQPMPTNCATQTEIPQAECQALVALYTSTNGAHWNDSPGNGWNRTQTPCSWTGVTCSADSPRHVTRIERTQNVLVGTLPDLSGLVSLQGLILGMNSLSGPVPALPISLREIWLGENQLGGSVPDFSTFTSLQYLDIWSNRLSGSVPANWPAGLEVISLGSNQLTGSIPSNWPTSLIALDLGDNQLTGSIPTNLPAGLSELYLGKNHLSGGIPANLPTGLRTLYLDRNQLSGTIPDLSALTKLEYVQFNLNQLSGAIPASVCTARLLGLSHNMFTEAADPCVTTKVPGWANTQTVPPSNLQAEYLSPTSLKWSWTPIPYTDDGGYYEVRCSNHLGGPYTLSMGTTASTGGKTATSLTATVAVGAPYYCKARTFTPKHDAQQNDLMSIDSPARYKPPQGPNLRISSNVPAAKDIPVGVPVNFSANSRNIAAIAFSIDFEQTCLTVDKDGNGIVDSVTFSVPGEFTANVSYSAADTDGELDFLISDFAPPLASLPSGALVTISFTPTCQPQPGTTQPARVGFSSDPAASFGNTSGQSEAGATIDGSIEIQAVSPGDGNGDGTVNAGDISAIVLEIFDGDGADPGNAGGGTFPGTSGCDANRDGKIDAADISCTVLIIFGQPCGSAVQGGASLGAQGVAAAPMLAVPARVPILAGSKVVVPVTFTSHAESIASVVYSLDYDERWLSLDPTDANSDGVPDAVRFVLPVGFTAVVAHDAADVDGEIDIAIADLLPPLASLSDGVLAEITLTVGDPPGLAEAFVRFSHDPAASFGSVTGQSVAGNTSDGIISVVSPDFFMPLIFR